MQQLPWVPQAAFTIFHQIVSATSALFARSISHFLIGNWLKRGGRGVRHSNSAIFMFLVLRQGPLVKHAVLHAAGIGHTMKKRKRGDWQLQRQRPARAWYDAVGKSCQGNVWKKWATFHQIAARRQTLKKALMKVIEQSV